MDPLFFKLFTIILLGLWFVMLFARHRALWGTPEAPGQIPRSRASAVRLLTRQLLEAGLTTIEPEDGQIVATDTIGGRRVTVRCHLKQDGTPYQLHARVELDAGVLPGVTIRPVRPGPASTQVRPIGDLILDGQIEVEVLSPGSRDRALAVPHLQQRLADPKHDLRGLLLDVLKGLDRAEVRSGGVELRTARGPVDLPELLPTLLALAQALDGTSPTLIAATAGAPSSHDRM